MPDLAALPFKKMNGLGNDFVILDGRTSPVRVAPEEARAIADRAHGPGFDQLIVLEKSPAGADVFMRILNADGSESGACGNATRCVGRLVMAERGRGAVTIETIAGLLKATDAGAWDRVAVDMGKPRFDWRDIPLSESFQDTRGIELYVGPIDRPVLHTPSVVNVGNPHCIFWVDDLDVVDLAKVGPMLEHHPLFPERANISLARVVSRERVEVKVWERGVGLTLACGTAACAVAVSAVRKRLTGRSVTIGLPGGDLHILWRPEDDHIVMTGPIQLDYESTLDPKLFEGIEGVAKARAELSA